MADRKSLFSTLWFISALALLASVLVAPDQTSRFVSLASSPDLVRRDLTSAPALPTTCLNPIIATERVLELNVLPFENEEQDRTDALAEPRIAFLITCSTRKVTDRQLVAPRSILSHYPLRC
jgi:hypothetical protein